MARRTMLVEPGTQNGTCRSCNAAIVWVTTASGKRMPMNPPVVFAPDSTRELDMARTTSHFVTCPQAGQWRKPFKAGA